MSNKEAKTKDNPLYNLVMSMTRSEKRYFRRFSLINSSRKEGNYMKLFDRIGRSRNRPDAEEDELRRHYGKKNQLPALKNYLYNMILKCLELYHTGVNASLMSYIHQAGIMLEKRLFSDCNKIILRAKQIADKNEKHWHMAELLRLENELFRIRNYAGTDSTEVDRLFVNLSAAVDRYRTENECARLVSSLDSVYYRTGPPRSSRELASYNKTFREVLSMSRDKNIHSNYRAVSYLNGWFITYYLMKHDFEKAYLYSLKQVDLMESVSWRIRDNFTGYLHALLDVVALANIMKNSKEALSVIHKIRSIEIKDDKTAKAIFATSFLMELSAYYNTGEFDKSVAIIERNKQKLEAVMPYVTDRKTIYYHLFYAHFGAGRFSDALRHVNMLLSDEGLNYRADIYYFAKIVFLIIHLELGNTDLLEYLVKSTYRYLYKRNRLHRFETEIIRFIRKLPGIRSGEELKGAFVALRKALAVITKDPFEKSALEYFDFISWLDAKISHRPFAEIVRDKAHITKY